MAFECDRLAEALNESISDDDSHTLGQLLKNNDGPHAVTANKHHPRDFSHRQILAELERGQQLRPLFDVARRIIEQTGISSESVRYYASLMDYYTAYKLKRMRQRMMQLYLLCFVYDRH